jgi:hypothetical protein
VVNHYRIRLAQQVVLCHRVCAASVPYHKVLTATQCCVDRRAVVCLELVWREVEVPADIVDGRLPYDLSLPKPSLAERS